MNTNIYFLTFGGPTTNYHDAVKRICKQAESFRLFNKIFEYTDIDLKQDTVFWNKHGNFIEKNPRGYGYWLWKPYLIMKTLGQLDDNDILIYCDCGIELNINGKKRLIDLINKTNEKLIIGSRASSTDYTFTKMDLIKYFGLDDVVKLKMDHMQPGCLILKKCDKIIKLVEEWYEIGSNNYHFIDDSPSIMPNFDGFHEHRHDQSIFNLLVKKYNLINYEIGHTCWGDGVEAKDNYIKMATIYPFWICRNISGKSIID